MKKSTVLKDFGSINIPTCWEEVTLKQFSELMSITNGETKNVDIISLMSIFGNKDREYINSLPAEFVESIMANLIFLNDTPDMNKVSSEIYIDGELYRINFMEQMRFGEYVQVNEIIKNNHFDYSGILSVLCRKPDEEFDDDFAANKYQSRKKMFEKIKVTDAMPLIAFFLHLYIASKKHSQESLKEVEQQINQLLTHIENSAKHGGGIRRYLNWRMRILPKLKKYKKAMSQMSCSI